MGSSPGLRSGKMSRYRGYWGNKITRADLKTDYNRLSRGNHDLGQSGNSEWEAALAKVTVGGGGVIGTDIDQKLIGKVGSHCISCCTVM